MILHWFNVHLWGPLWPNMFAPSFITLSAVCVSHAKQIRQRERQHAELKAHITVTLGGQANG